MGDGGGDGDGGDGGVGGGGGGDGGPPPQNALRKLEKHLWLGHGEAQHFAFCSALRLVVTHAPQPAVCGLQPAAAEAATHAGGSSAAATGVIAAAATEEGGAPTRWPRAPAACSTSAMASRHQRNVSDVGIVPGSFLCEVGLVGLEGGRQ